MKSNEEYLNDFHLKKKELEERGELWRLRVTEDEFISEIERIRKESIESRKGSSLNEYHIQRNEEEQIEIMLMEKATYEEAKEQFERLRKSGEEYFAKEAPEIHKLVKLINTPLKFKDSRNIYLWLYRKQITIDMLPENVLKEFITTKHYRNLKIDNIV